MSRLNLRKRLDRTVLAGVFGALLGVGLGLVPFAYPYWSGLVRASYDFLMVYQGNHEANEAVVVYLDEESAEKLGQSLNAQWDRGLHAKLIERLTAAGARVIVFDMVFVDPANGNGGDDRMAAALKESGRVILGAEFVRGDEEGKSHVQPPLDVLRNNAAGIADVGVDPDPADLVVRRHLSEQQIPPLSWATAKMLGAKIVTQGRLHSGDLWMYYYGPPESIPSVSYYAALDPASVPDKFFKDKAVFVGGRVQTHFAGERKDQYPNPFPHPPLSPGFSPGVEIHATAFLNLVRGEWLTRLPAGLELSIVLAVGLVFGWGLTHLRPPWATAVALGAIAVAIAASIISFSRQFVWFPVLICVVQIVAVLFWSIVFNSLQLYVQKRLFEQTLRLYLPPSLVPKFARSRDFLKPGARKQILTVLFSDVADFTSISEGMDSDELAAMMNEYFQVAVSECIHKTGGTVAKYIGDGIFTFWNAPDGQPDHEVRACEAGLLLRRKTQTPIRGRLLRTRVGLHTGLANVGNFGSLERVDYTALGENVNLASRLEGLNKYLGTSCLISGVTKQGLGDRLVTRPLGKFQLKGFAGLVEAHELVGWPDEAESTRPWREAFAEALNNYEQRNLELARPGFQHVLELRPDDGPAKFFLERIAVLARESQREWATHTILKEK